MNDDGPDALDAGVTVSLRELLAEATSRVGAGDARRIVEVVSGHPAGELGLHLDRPVTAREMAYFDGLLVRRAGGEPLQYVLGTWGFRTLDLFLDRRVLIPRSETEVVAGHAIGELDRVLAARHTLRGRVVDLGTGSGAIALAVAVERATAEVWATDRSPEALEVASANLAGLGRPARRVTVVEGDWFDALPGELRGQVDVVVSNPPYVAEDETLPAEVRDWEPLTALVPGPTGLEAYESIVSAAPSWLRPEGSLVLEIGSTQGEAVTAIAARAGFADVAVHPDLVGRDRVVVARMPRR